MEENWGGDGEGPSLDLKEHLSTPATPDLLSRQTSNLSEFLGELEAYRIDSRAETHSKHVTTCVLTIPILHLQAEIGHVVLLEPEIKAQGVGNRSTPADPRLVVEGLARSIQNA